MLLSRRAPNGFGRTAWAVLACGAISGAALAAGHGPAAPADSAAAALDLPAVEVPAVEALTAATEPSEPVTIEVPTVVSPAAATPEDVVVPDPTRQILPNAELPGAAAPTSDDDALPLQLRDSRRQTTADAQSTTGTAGLDATASEASTRTPLAWFIALLGGLLAIAAVVFHGRKTGTATRVRDASIEVASTVRLGGRWQVSLVRVPGRMLVLGATDKGVSLLTELDDDFEEIASGLGADDHSGDALERRADVDVLAALAAGTGAAPHRAPRTPAATATYSRPRPLAVSLEPAAHEAAEVPHAETPATRDTTREARATPSDAFLDHFLERLSNARPAVVRSTRPTDERAELIRRVASMGRGPTRL